MLKLQLALPKWQTVIHTIGLAAFISTLLWVFADVHWWADAEERTARGVLIFLFHFVAMLFSAALLFAEDAR